MFTLFFSLLSALSILNHSKTWALEKTCREEVIHQIGLPLPEFVTKQLTDMELVRTLDFQRFFRKKMIAAVERATSDLSHASHIHFRRKKDTFIDLKMHSSWEERCRNGNCFVAVHSGSSALRDLTGDPSPIYVDCAVGLQLAEYFSILNFYGDSNFDKAFEPSSIFIGSWSLINSSKSLTRGNSAPTPIQTSIPFFEREKLNTWIGLSGFLLGEGDLSRMRSPSDRAENFIITGVSQSAATQLSQLGSLEAWSRLTREAQLLASQFPAKWIENKPPQFLVTGARGDAYNDFLDLLRQPALAEVQIYVHPLGVQTIAWHLQRLARINSKNTYKIGLYPDRMTEGWPLKWFQDQVNQCIRSRTDR